MVEALHCSGSHSACRGVHFSVVDEDHGTGSASCDIVQNGPVSLYSRSFNTCQGLKCLYVSSILTETITKFTPTAFSNPL